jgi:hypothetical protein
MFGVPAVLTVNGALLAGLGLWFFLSRRKLASM